MKAHALMPSLTRAAHLSSIRIPMLFVQGTRDALATWDLMSSVISRLGATATLASVDPADHSFHVPVRSGRADAEVMQEVLDAIGQWTSSIIGKH